MTKTEAKRLRPVLAAVARVNLDGLGPVAETFLERQKRPSTAPPRSQRPAAAARKRKRLTKREETAAIRGAVFERAHGIPASTWPLCELCAGPRNVRRVASELAHLEGGTGRRKQRQSARNTAASCHPCNVEWDKNPAHRPEMAARWSERTGLPIPPGVLAAAALKGWTVPARPASCVHPDDADDGTTVTRREREARAQHPEADHG